MHIDPQDRMICASGDPEETRGAARQGSRRSAPRPSPAATPIYQSSLFTFPDFEGLLDGFGAEHRTNLYSRGKNPTVQVLERKLAALERGEACLCFSSGMAAVSAVMLGLLRSGDHVLFVNDTYGPTLQLAQHLTRFGIEHDLQLDLDLESIERAIRPNTRLLWLESPGTMRFRQFDIGAVASLARERGILTGIDNSWATPLCQKPLTLGVDIVMHTCSKYIGGHSDVIAGALVTTPSEPSSCSTARTCSTAGFWRRSTPGCCCAGCALSRCAWPSMKRMPCGSRRGSTRIRPSGESTTRRWVRVASSPRLSSAATRDS